MNEYQIPTNIEHKAKKEKLGRARKIIARTALVGAGLGVLGNADQVPVVSQAHEVVVGINETVGNKIADVFGADDTSITIEPSLFQEGVEGIQNPNQGSTGK